MMDKLHGMPAKGSASLLERLPLREPDPALWERIQRERGRRQWRQRVRRRSWLAGSLAAAALLLVVLLPRMAVDPETGGELTHWRASAQTLEHEWQASGRATLDSRFRAELNLIDVQLQAAYDRGATEAELAPLWKLRSDALQELLRSDNDQPLAITRI